MALVLLLLLASFQFASRALLVAAVIVHVLNMVAPRAFRPLAPLWFGLGHLIGAVTSRVLMGAVFALIVTPIGMARRALGKDSLRLRAFRTGDESVMTTRRHTFTAADLEKLY